MRHGCSHLDTGGVVVDHVEDVDQAEQDGYQETHPSSHHIRGNDEWGPGYDNEEAGGNIIYDDVFVILPADVNIESSQRQVTQLSVIVEVQTRKDSRALKPYRCSKPSVPIIVVAIVTVRSIPEGDIVVQVCVLLVHSAVHI